MALLDPVDDLTKLNLEPGTRVLPPHADPEFPQIPHTIYRPPVGSPFYIDPRFKGPSFLSRPGTPPLTLEVVRRELEDFP